MSQNPHPTFPWGSLLALSAAGFLAIITETIPAGLLPQISAGLGVTESAAGQLVTFYALGSVVAAIPLVSTTAHLGRKRVLVGAVLTLLVLNTVTAVAPWYWLILPARFAAGAAAALVWGVLAGYARRLVPATQQGRALAVCGTGQPIALTVGVPLGTLLASTMDWRWIFVGITVAAALLVGWIIAVVPEVDPIASTTAREPIVHVVGRPGVLLVLLVGLTWVLAHNILYTYVAPILEPTGLNIALGLTIFGVFSFVGISATGVLIDRTLRYSVIVSLLFTGIAALTLANVTSGATGTVITIITAIAIACWGLGFGGAPSQLQTALADRAGHQVDAAQSVFVTVFNAAVAGGGLIGGGLLSTTDATTSLGWAAGALVIAALIIAVSARRAFPAGAR